MHKQYYNSEKDCEPKEGECLDCFGRGWSQTLTKLKTCETCKGTEKNRKGNEMRILCLSIAAITLCSCGVAEKFTDGIAGSSYVCVNGVQYIQFTSGASVAYNRDGTIRTCGDKKL